MKRIGFALEYSLGHTTHARNLKQVLKAGDFPDVAPYYVDLPFDGTPVGAWAKLPPVRSNWSVRASLGAYLGLRSKAAGSLDAALFHTQITSLFSAGFMRRVPSVVSLDATPIQIDSLGQAYNHAPSGSGRIEALKKRMNMQSFTAASHLVTWSEWVKSSLVADYGVAAEKVTVIPPGVDTDAWNCLSRAKGAGDKIDLLFVGGDFVRKGGETLITAFNRLPAPVRSRSRLHLVTKTAPASLTSEVAKDDGIQVYSNMTANSSELRQLYANADLFVFPTQGDTFGIAVLEALASGLPVITTSVGALSEVVVDGETGRIVPVEDPAALAQAMEGLIGDADLRRTMGGSARASAVARFDAATNYRRLIETVEHQAR